MFDFHMHSKLSFDSSEEPELMIKAAVERGLKEICFTDHYDFNSEKDGHHDLFSVEDYMVHYSGLKSDDIKIRMGVEFGLTTWNAHELRAFLDETDLDFVIGSVHYVGGYDPYYEEFWKHTDFKNAILNYMAETYNCVKTHTDYDVLGHLTYVCKSSYNPTGGGVAYNEISDITDEILKIVISNGKGIEVNTSGVDRIGEFLPTVDFVKRFCELGGEIITIGSDAHDKSRVGRYAKEACEMIKTVCPYVCTFEKRKPIFHKL